MAAEGGVAFAFRFDPAVRKAVAEMARNLADGRPQTGGTALEWKEPVVDWSSGQIEAYKRLLCRNRIDATREVNEFLSPYLIPLTLGASPPEVAKLLAVGHTTVIRLPLDGGRTGTAEEADRIAAAVGHLPIDGPKSARSRSRLPSRKQPRQARACS